MEDTTHQLSPVAGEHLQIPSGPAEPLLPGLAEAGGLLVVQYRRAAVADLLPPDHVVNAELNVLCQQEEVPAAAARKDLL